MEQKKKDKRTANEKGSKPGLQSEDTEEIEEEGEEEKDVRRRTYKPYEDTFGKEDEGEETIKNWIIFAVAVHKSPEAWIISASGA